MAFDLEVMQFPISRVFCRVSQCHLALRRVKQKINQYVALIRWHRVYWKIIKEISGLRFVDWKVRVIHCLITLIAWMVHIIFLNYLSVNTKNCIIVCLMMHLKWMRLNTLLIPWCLVNVPQVRVQILNIVLLWLSVINFRIIMEQNANFIFLCSVQYIMICEINICKPFYRSFRLEILTQCIWI